MGLFSRSPVKRLDREGDVEGLIALLADPKHRADAANALAHRGSPRVEEAPLALLSDPDSDVRGQATFALGELAHQQFRRAREALPGMLADEDPIVRLLAATALYRVEGAAAVELLRPLAADDDDLLREQVREMLRDLGA